MGNFIYTSALIFLFFFLSCAKIKDDCTEPGPPASETRLVGSFHEIVANNRMLIELIQDSSKHGQIVLDGPANLLDGIRCEVINMRLSITNKNKCKWLRELNTRIRCLVYVKNLSRIESQHDASFLSKDTLHLTSLTINHQSTAIQHILIHAGTIYLDHRDAGEVILDGRCAVFVPTLYETGKLSAHRLFADDVFIFHYGLNRAEVSAINTLECRIENKGSIYYHSNPTNPIIIKGNGKGKVIRAL